MARLKPLPENTHPELAGTLQVYKSYMGYVPNSVLIMQHRPKLVKALAQMASAVWDAESEVDCGFKRLLTYVAGKKYGCQYSMAHAAEAAHRGGVDIAKIEAVCDYRNSPLYNEAERLALDFAVAAASQPNAVTDELFQRLQQHWTDGQIVELAAVIAQSGFINRWSDTMAVPLEPPSVEFAEKYLAPQGWHIGKHGS
jgi:alkylhydroperoxidase family enzyme